MNVQVIASSHLLHLSLLQYNIHAYPTTVIFNKSSIHEYEGHHSADGILEFIEVRKDWGTDYGYTSSYPHS